MPGEIQTDGGTSPSLSPEEERAQILATQRVYGQELGEVGTTCYVVSAKWWRAWRGYTGYDPNEATPAADLGSGAYSPFRGGAVRGAERPGPITNEDILDEETDGGKPMVKRQKMEKYDYELLPPETWQLLFRWYGGVPLPRRVVADGDSPYAPKRVEVAFSRLRVFLAEARDNVKVVHISKRETVGELVRRAAAALGVRADDYRAWDMMSGSKFAVLSNEGLGLEAARLMDEQDVMLERRDAMEEEDAKEVKEDEDDSAYYSSGVTGGRVYYSSPNGYGGGSRYGGGGNGGGLASSWAQDAVSGGPPAQPGLVGLGNLGNTCFMNSALQCLGHVAPLRAHVLGGRAAAEVNEGNPLGTGGRLLRAYEALLRAMWGGGGRVVTPRNFKYVLGQHASQFVGYDQHDSQELIAYLLDMIHEDLNRIENKPYVEKVEAKADEADGAAAARAWGAHRLRNDSVVVDTFQGQYKSVVTCPACGRVSTTFDPFMYLTLPLPAATERNLAPLLFPAGGGPPQRLVVKVARTARIGALRRALAARAGLAADRLRLCDMWDHKVYAALEDDQEMDTIAERDVTYAYELPAPEALGAAAAAEGGVEEAPGPWADTLRRRFLTEEAGAALRDHCLEDEGFDLEEARALLAKLSRAEAHARRAEEHEIEAEVWRHRRAVRGVHDVASLAAFSAALAGFRAFVGARSPREPLTVLHQRVQSYSSTYYTSYWKNFGDPIAAALYPGRTTVGMLRRHLARHLARVLAPPPPPPGGGGGGAAAAATAEEEEENALGVLARELDVAVISDSANRTAATVLMGAAEAGEEPPSRDEDLLEDHLGGSRLLAIRWRGESYDRFWDEARAGRVEEEAAAAGGGGKGGLSVHDCLASFLRREQLEETEMWYCPGCKEHRQAWKQFFLWRTPPVLLVHLKRFGSDGYGFREKVEDLVDFPLRDLDFSQHCLDPAAPPARYDLAAVSNHFGGLGGGHYTAYARNEETGKWYDFDDSHVEEIDESQVVTAAGYVLFYIRKDVQINPDHLVDQARIMMEIDDDIDQKNRKVAVAGQPQSNRTVDDYYLTNDDGGKVPAIPNPAGLESTSTDDKVRNVVVTDKEDSSDGDSEYERGFAF